MKYLFIFLLFSSTLHAERFFRHGMAPETRLLNPFSWHYSNPNSSFNRGYSARFVSPDYSQSTMEIEFKKHLDHCVSLAGNASDEYKDGVAETVTNSLAYYISNFNCKFKEGSTGEHYCSSPPPGVTATFRARIKACRGQDTSNEASIKCIESILLKFGKEQTNREFQCKVKEGQAPLANERSINWMPN